MCVCATIGGRGDRCCLVAVRVERGARGGLGESLKVGAVRAHERRAPRAQRLVAAAAEPAQFVGLLLGIPLASKLMAHDPGLGLRLMSIVTLLIAGAFTVFALAPVLWLTIAAPSAGASENDGEAGGAAAQAAGEAV